MMVDDKSKRGAPDRAQVAGSEQYEVSYFAGKHAISAEDARRIIAAAGPSREQADQPAELLKRSERPA